MERIRKIWSGKAAGKALAVLLALFLVPVSAFYLMQFVYGGWPWEYSLPVVLGNSLCVGIFYCLLVALSGRMVFSAAAVEITAALWGAANYFVVQFRGNPVLPWDFTALGTAAAVSGTYRIVPTRRMMLAAACLVLLCTAAAVLRKRRWLRVRLLGRAAALACCLICLHLVFRTDTLKEFGVSADVWDQAGAYRERGMAGAFVSNLKYLNVEVPEGYSPERADELLMAAQAAAEGEEGTRLAAVGDPALEAEIPAEKPHIIAIMNESWADFEEFGNLSLTENPMEYINSLDGAKGHAYTSVFGAGTSASEFEFLTGNTMAFLPPGSIPYQQYILQPSPSMASVLKENGYTCLAFHPGEASSWQRNQAYPLLGFDQFKCGDDMDVEAVESHGYVNDQSDFNQVIWEFENREPGEKLFLFNVTIQSHGSYTDPDYPARVQLEGKEGVYPMAEQYLTLVQETDQAFEKLIRYFEEQEEPVLIVMFGDHQPSVEQEFLDLAYGVEQKDMTMEEYMGKFRVPFVIWSNYGLEPKIPEITSLNFLGQYVLDLAGIESDIYGDFLREFRNEIPALTFSGYFDSEGEAHSHLETNAFDEKIEEYQIVQYHRMFGRE